MAAPEVTASTATDLVRETETWVQSKLASYDASHDFQHIERVRKMALRLARTEGLEDLELVEIAALVHDVDDYKYSGSETAGIENVGRFLETQVCVSLVVALLRARTHVLRVPNARTSRAQGYDASKVRRVQEIMEGVSFRKELGSTPVEIPPELAVVQDADRLDAIGAIGVARCITYGGSKGRPLYDGRVRPVEGMTREEYMRQADAGGGVTINHFYEKLLRLKDMMKTKAGRAVAEQRHEFMLTFLDQFHREVAGLA